MFVFKPYIGIAASMRIDLKKQPRTLGKNEYPQFTLNKGTRLYHGGRKNLPPWLYHQLDSNLQIRFIANSAEATDAKHYWDTIWSVCLARLL